jgi:hypothetical protein
MRRHVSLICLILAWLCANGAMWDAVQVVAWGRMFATYSSYLPVRQALARTFDGSKPCELCAVAQQGHDDATRQQSPTSPGESERLVLACETAAPVVLTQPEFSWPGVVDDSGLLRTDPVPVPPPRV